MGGLYNVMNGYNLACALLAPMIADYSPQEFFPRFRDCFLGDRETIEIYTRVGGGNREYYEDEIEKLRSMPTYLYDEDDGFDCTYATFTFGVPDEWRADFEAIRDIRLNAVSDAYIERMQQCFPSLDIRKLMGVDGSNDVLHDALRGE